MLAGPPPTNFNTSPTLPTIQSQPNPSMYPNQYQPPTLPPNFVAKQPMYPPVVNQPPLLPPNYSNNHYQQPSPAPTNVAPSYLPPPAPAPPHAPMMNNGMGKILSYQLNYLLKISPVSSFSRSSTTHLYAGERLSIGTSDDEWTVSSRSTTSSAYGHDERNGILSTSIGRLSESVSRHGRTTYSTAVSISTSRRLYGPQCGT